MEKEKEKEDLVQRRTRLRKLLAAGKGTSLEEEELLWLLLDYGAPRRDSEPVLRNLLERFGSIEGALYVPPAALMSVEGMTKETLVLLRLLVCMERRAAMEARPVLRGTQEWIEYLRPLFLRQRRERVYLLCLAGTGRLCECAFLGEGSDSVVHLDIQRLCSVAQRSGAKGVVLAHSHPSGMAMPSQEDIMATLSCRSTLSELKIRLLDHLVFTDEDCVSMSESGLL